MLTGSDLRRVLLLEGETSGGRFAFSIAGGGGGGDCFLIEYRIDSKSAKRRTVLPLFVIVSNSNCLSIECDLL